MWQKLPWIYIKVNNTDVKRKSISYVAVMADLNHFSGYVCLHIRVSSSWICWTFHGSWCAGGVWSMAPPIPSEISWCSFHFLALSLTNALFFSEWLKKAFPKSRNEMGFPTLFGNQVLLIARLFLAYFLGQYCDTFLSTLGPTCSVAALKSKMQRSVTKNPRFPVTRGQANGTSCISISWR